MSRLRILKIEEQPLTELRYLNAARGGGTTVERLPITRGCVTELPDGLDAIVACSDLQGVVPGTGREAQLLGIAVAQQLEELAFDGLIPPAARIGVVLAGDLFSVPAADKRGGHGDVADVWAAFAERFAWVAGVAGNHDDITNVASLGERVHLLDGETVELDGVRIGGVGRIIGNPSKRGRRSEEDQLALLDRAIDAGLDILVVHEGPHGDADHGQRGNSTLRDVVDAGGVPLTICGHDHWHEPLAASEHGQILNVDARVIVLVARPA